MAFSEDKQRIMFRNPKTGELRVYSYSSVAFFFFGAVYLGYKGWWREAARMVAGLLLWFALCYVMAMLLMLASIAVQPLALVSQMLYVDDSYGGTFGFLTYVGLLVVYIWFLIRMPNLIIKDLFASGFAPRSDDDWKLLKSIDALANSQLSSYEQAWRRP